MWERAKTRGLVSDYMDWSILKQEFNEVRDRSIIMSEVVPREELFKLYMKFKRLQQRRFFLLALKNPRMSCRVLNDRAKIALRYLKAFFSSYPKALKEDGQRV